MVPSKKIVAFRCEASPTIGTGHVMRCLTLANQLVLQGSTPEFLCTPETLKSISALQRSGYNISTFETPIMPDWLVVDHYDIDADCEKAARKNAKNIFVIDDLANRPHDCEILLDQTFGRKEKDYEGLVSRETILLLGSEYALLRPEFVTKRKKLARIFSAGRRVLVSYGGVNPKGSTEKALEMLSTYAVSELNIDVVVGGGAVGLDNVREIINTLNGNGFHKATLYVDTPHIADLMEHADLCLGAGGTTSWERCCLGLPTLTFELADNQTQTLKTLGEFGALVNLGRIEDISSENFLRSFTDLVASSSIRRTMSDRAMMVCDGRGAERVACTLLPPEQSKDNKNVMMRYALPCDARDIFDMQCAAGVRTHARNPAPPTWEGHSAWYSATMSNPHRRLFIILYDGQKAGIARLDLKEGETHEVSILISPEFQGKGLGVATLKLLRSSQPSAIFRAEILPGNAISHKIFDKAGYRPTDNGWHISEPAKQE